MTRDGRRLGHINPALDRVEDAAIAEQDLERTMPFDATVCDLKFDGSLRVDEVLATADPVPSRFLAQSVRYHYQQQVNRLYEVDSRRVYVVAGRTHGVANVAGVRGTAHPDLLEACSAEGNSIRVRGKVRVDGQCESPVSLATEDNVIASLNCPIRTEHLIVVDDVTMLFQRLNFGR